MREGSPTSRGNGESPGVTGGGEEGAGSRSGPAGSIWVTGRYQPRVATEHLKCYEFQWRCACQLKHMLCGRTYGRKDIKDFINTLKILTTSLPIL